MDYLSDSFLAELLSGVNVVLALTLVYYNLIQARRQSGFLRVFALLSVLIGLYWAGLYTFVILTKAGSFDAVFFGRVFVRPAFTFTLAMMASVAVYRSRAKRL